MLRWIFCFTFATAAFASDVKICLSIVVENDEETIAQCLESVKNLVDYISIYDTGSTDRTLAIAEEFLAEIEIPGTIHKHDLKKKDNPHALAMQTAKKAIKKYKFAPQDTYILALEPNTILNIDHDFQKNDLEKDAYLLLEKTTQFSSYNPHLLRSHLPWEAVGSIHPQWICPSPYQSDKCKTLTLEKQIPHQEIERLTKAFKEEGHERYLFYLAQIHQEMKQYDRAIQFYQQRLEKKGHLEESWFSKYMIGECYENLEKWDDALYWYLEAYQANPDRAEPLKKISTHYRLLGRNDLAYIFAKFGSRLPFPEDQTYFTANPLEHYQFNEELSIVSFYTQFKEDGYTAASELVLKKNVPHSLRNQTYRNLLFYVQPLPEATYRSIDIDLPLAKEGVRCNPMNPSILKTAEGYRVICRTVNYTQTGAKDFYSHAEDGIFRSRNFLIHYDTHFNLLSQKEIIDNLLRDKIGHPRVQGFEDCRIFEFNQSSWFTCTTTDTNPTGSYQISLCKLDETESLESLVPLKGPDPHRCEKNWLPFVQDDKLYMVYSYDPFVIYEPNPKTGICTTTLHYQPGHDFSSFRGSAGPIPFDNGYLILVHEVVFLPDSQRAYLHRFLFLDGDLVPRKASKPFIFKHIGVEYCCSMTLDHTENQLILGVGLEDKEALLCTVPCKTIHSLLSPL
ncbi:MAG: hypothetical protein KGJ02_06130 [Verrucomicrobiota bacterium]|nr:hypothetical protein [Verrucomicrobiota bacterium]